MSESRVLKIGKSVGIAPNDIEVAFCACPIVLAFFVLYPSPLFAIMTLLVCSLLPLNVQASVRICLDFYHDFL